MFVNVVLVIHQFLAEILFGIGGPRAQTGNAIDYISRQMEAVEIV